MKPRANRRTQTKRGQARRRGPSPAKAGLVQEITGVLLAALGVWLYFGLGRLGGGQVGDWFAQLLGLLFGQVRWVVPGGLIALGCYFIFLRRGQMAPWRLWGLLLLFLAASAAFHFRHDPSVMFAGPNLPKGGGYLGAILAYPLTLGLGEAGRWVFVVAAGLIGLLMLTQGSLGALLQAGGERAVKRGRSLRDLFADFWALLTKRPDPAEGEPAPKRSAGLPPAYQAEVSGRRLEPPAAQPPVWGAEAADEPWGDAEGGVEPAVLGAVASEPIVKSAGADEGPVSSLGPAEGQGAGSGSEWPHGAEAVGSPSAQTAPGAKAQATGGKGQPAEPVEVAGDVAVGGPSPQRPYQLPPVKLLGEASRRGKGDSHKEVLARSQLLEKTLATFGVEAKVLEVHVGPAITRFELQPAPGVKVSRIVNLADDLALNLAATDVRIEAPIPGKAAVGIEVPNHERAAVLLRDVVESREFRESAAKLPIALGKDIAGRPVVGALEKMPHLLIAGATGSGKSVCMNTIILSILMKARPDEVKMLMVDPKMVELSSYNGIPHLAAPVCTDPRKAAGYLKWAVKEMENRYELFAAAGVRDITRYNELCERDPGPDRDNPRQPLPYIVILIDELADLMMVAPGEVEDAICRLAQMARACGMHLVIATQRPSVDVITGLIKANVPSRIAFAVSSQVDSRTILDMGGAEKLLGRGDMLYYPVGKSKPERAQGAFIDEKEVDAVVSFVEGQGKPDFQAEALEVETKGGTGVAGGDDGFDPALGEAVRIIIEEERASVSVLQRRLRVNYTKAARLIDDMFEQGWIGPHNGPRPRDVYITMPQWQEIFGDGGGSDEVAAAEEG